MTDWTDTAKRMAASPKWVWRNGMHWTTDSDDYGIVGWLRDPPEPDAYPQLQGWAMTGIILGTVIPGKPSASCGWSWWHDRLDRHSEADGGAPPVEA